jgi:hypothetical protein
MAARPILAIFLVFMTFGEAWSAEHQRVTVDARYRAESVTDDAMAERSLASTLRLRLGYLTPRQRGWQGFVEFEGIREIGDGDYNSTANGKTGHPAIADPEDAELNQAYLSWGSNEREILLGRQRINMANQRFIGAVGFRQNEQTFDAAMFRSQAAGGRLELGYISRVNRIFGAHHPNPALAATYAEVSLLDYQLTFGDLTAGAYLHLMGFPDSPTTSHRNAGIRLAAKHGAMDWRAEYAAQRPYRDGASIIDADYYRIDLGWNIDALHFGVIREVLAGNGGYAFQTPLATLHAFNGATDKFAVTPPGGLIDDAVEVTGQLESLKYGAAAHRFRSDSEPVDYGRELAGWVALPLGKRVESRLELAGYSADSFAADTVKIWFTISARY